MRSKLFLSFLAVMFTALVSNLIFERLTARDFEEYAEGAREDRLYWVMASVEGSYDGGGWDIESLKNSLHWATMLGFDAEVRDASGATVLTSTEAFEGLGPSMKKRMSAAGHPGHPIHLQNPEVGGFEEYPLFMGGGEIGKLLIRPLSIEGLRMKETTFKRRGKTFLLISFLIAGGGALLLSVAFSIYLTAPLKRLKKAAEAISAGDLNVRVRAGAKDEVGRLTETFNGMAETLQRQERLRKHLTSNIAHELRTPMSVIRANLEALSDGVVEPKEALENITGETQRLISLVSGIEDMTKAEASFFTPLEQSGIELGEFLGGIAQGMRPLFEEKGLALRVLEGMALKVYTDAAKLEKIVRNILSNALKFTEKGGVLIDFGPDKDKKEFFIEIRDTGPGIPESDLPMVFERFYRGGKGDGLGLGLSIAKELAEVMGGRIEVRSKVGEGTDFKVTLPLL